MDKAERDLHDAAYLAWENGEELPGVSIEALDDNGKWVPVTFRKREQYMVFFEVDEHTDIAYDLAELQSYHAPVRVKKNE